MKKLLVILFLLIAGCGPSEPTVYPPPSIVTTITEEGEKITVRVGYSHHVQSGYCYEDFSNKEDLEDYIQKMETTIVILKETAEKMKSTDKIEAE